MKLQFYLRNPKLTLEFPNFKLIFYLLYLLISLNVVNDLFRYFSNGLQRYALFYFLQTFFNIFSTF